MTESTVAVRHALGLPIAEQQQRVHRYELRDAFNNEGMRSRAWTSRAGKHHGGLPFTHGAL